jgi:signal transduction histidine kinase
MRRLKHFFSPLTIMIIVQVIWIMLLIFWILWFLGRHYELRSLAEHYRPELVPTHLNWPVLVSGIALLALILAGLYVIFIYWQRQSRLNMEQKNFISQITHELKSPLASIQLHLETIRLRKPPPEKLERFLDTMLVDTERLNNLINNLLMAAKLEQRALRKHFPPVDLSAFVADFLEKFRKQLPENSRLTQELEPNITVAMDTEGMEMVLRNLLENAFLYSPASPDVRICLQQKGGNCLLTVSDNGRGIARKELKRIFQMFYRVRQAGETIKGTGLGLYIVRSVIRRHSGKVSVTSGGSGLGSTFTITLPLAKTDKETTREDHHG